MMKKNILITFLLIFLASNNLRAEFDGPGYYRVHNTSTNRFITVIGEQYHTSTNPDAFEDCVEMLAPGANNAQITNPASVIYINSVTKNVRLEAQGMDTYQITGMYLKVNTNTLNGETVYIPYITMVFTFYLQDYDGLDPGRGTDYAKYWIEPVNNEGNNYFAVEPTIQYNGHYYTTLRTAFNFQLPEGVKAYVIGSNGKAILYCNPGEIVAKATPVILQCESNLKENNKLLPTTSSAKTVPSTNQLVAPIGILSSSISGYNTMPNYFKYTYNAVRNKYVSRGVQRTDANYNYRVLGTDESGNVGFYKSFWNEQNGSETNTPVSCLDGNRAYLNTSNDVTVLGMPQISPSNSSANVGESISFNVSSTAPSATIYYRLDGEGEWIAVSGGTITITSNQAKNGTVEVKLDNGGIESPIVNASYSFIEPTIDATLATIVSTGIESKLYQVSDYLYGVTVAGGKLYAKDNNNYANKSIIENGQVDYMQRAGMTAADSYDQSNWVALNVENPDSYVGKDLSVTGTLLRKPNPEMTVTKITATDPEQSGYMPNVYIPASFMGETQTSTVGNQETFFFVTPKPQEYAHITWAVYGGDGKFYVAAPQGSINQAALKGGFVADGSLIGGLTSFESGETYEFYAIIQVNPSNKSPYLTGGYSTDYTVYPTSAPTVITAVNDVNVTKTIAGTRYYNLAGMASDQPFDGINIVVTTFSDGSKQAVKVLH